MSGTDIPDTTVAENAEAKRFEAHADGELLGFLDYIPLEGKIIATHTEVFPDHEGKGIGSALVRGVVTALRDDGRLLQPLCPYVTSWFRRHPDEADVLDRSAPH